MSTRIDFWDAGSGRSIECNISWVWRPVGIVCVESNAIQMVQNVFWWFSGAFLGV